MLHLLGRACSSQHTRCSGGPGEAQSATLLSWGLAQHGLSAWHKTVSKVIVKTVFNSISPCILFIVLAVLQEIMASLSRIRGAQDDSKAASVLVMQLQNAVQAKLRNMGWFKADASYGMQEFVIDMFGYQVLATHTAVCTP